MSPGSFQQYLCAHNTTQHPSLPPPPRASPPLPPLHPRHLRLLQCQLGNNHAWLISKSWPHLSTLIIKDGPLDGLGSSGVSALAQLRNLTALGVTVEAVADVRPLGSLTQLEYLLLDGRSNAALVGVKGLRGCQRLRALVLPLLQLHHDQKGTLHGLSAALPRCVISNISSNFGTQHGCQWCAHFSEREREWWRAPLLPWLWYPTLRIIP